MSSEIYSAVGIKPKDTPIVIDEDDYDLDRRPVKTNSFQTNGLDNDSLDKDDFDYNNSIIEVDETIDDTFTL
jgi:hypothetical protein